ncbi:DUF2341 domain-containing protein, partial [Methanosarcina sp. MSH10X1]|uniref:DUF2341 domain-containing protein n=1 Tax=Methanosarcina sp. MSH10X1 TaxID=2507075 RepID=UPI001F0C1A1A
MKIRNILFILILFLLMPGCAYADQNTYSQCKTITIDHTKVASDLTDFPMLVVIENDTDIGELANPNGTDINFLSSNGDQLAFEKESFSISDGACNANIWVKVPFLSSTTNTTLYLYYGNPGAVDAQNTSAVWDDGGFYNYSLVQHLDSDPLSSSPQFADSTSFQYNGTAFGGMTGSNLVSGKINNSIYFNGNGDYIQFDQPSKFNKSLYNPMIPNGEFGSMWYSGPGQYDAWYNVPSGKIMHAASTDGNHWVSDPDPALLPGQTGSWDSSAVEVPYVWKENSTWYMLFRGRSGIENKIGLATSTDGKNWTKYAGNPVLNASASGWESGVGQGFDPWGLIKIGPVYYLWYNTVNDLGDHTRMTGLATSTDLIHWTSDPNNPIFTGGRYCIQEFKYGDYYYMLVPLTTGFIELYRDKNPTFYPSERSYLGYVITANASSDWESDNLDTPSILSNDIYRNSFPSSDLQMYYTGGTADYVFSEGLATFPLSMLDKLPEQQNPEITALTMEGWINIPSSPLQYAKIATKHNSHSLVLQTVSSNTRLTTEMKTNTPWEYTATGQTIIPNNSWHHVAATYNATTGTVNYYIDGNFDTKDTTSCIGPVSISPDSLWLSTPEIDAGVTGRVDEIRISNIDRSAGYFKTGYNNQYSPETFSTLGPALEPGTVFPVANFTSNVSEGYAPLPVQFNDSSENADTVNWSFGDGSNSTEQDPVHTYSTAGNYT